tara:strand:- start:427 stop:1038 length:612 start_codon:yes stop_codon:yes gene_type:complete
MFKNLTKIFLFTSIILLSTNVNGEEITTHRIEVKVNDNIITNYDIYQRIKLNAIITKSNIDPNNYNNISQRVVDELIRESLKKEKILEYNISFTNDEMKKHEIRFLNNYQIEKEVLIELFKQNNISYSNFSDFLATELKWQKLIFGLYLRVISLSEIEIEGLLNTNPNLSRKDAEDIVMQKQLELKSNKLINDMQNEATIEYK